MLDTQTTPSQSFKKICIIGAGVMGQAIASHMANASLPCFLLDMPASGPDKNSLAKKAIKNILESSPPLLFSKNDIDLITIGNIEDDINFISECDLVIEAVVEKMNVKQELFKQLASIINKKAIVASNTSGLSVDMMCAGLPKDFCKRFLVMHFFNPVRYMHLLEIIPSKFTDLGVVNLVKNFAENRLGKGVVLAKNTPNFVANRLGIYGIMEAINLIKNGDYSIDEIDAVFGANLGRPKSAIFRTADVVGIDTLLHVANNCYEHQTNDECREIFKIPDFLTRMVREGFLGQKAGKGFYKKEQGEILSIDPKTMLFHKKQKIRFDSLGKIRNQKNLHSKIKTMYEADDRAAKLFFFLNAKSFIYAANRMPEIADDVSTIDNAMKWGFGWEMGPFEIWDAMGLKNSIARMKKEGFLLPKWVMDMLNLGRENFYNILPDGSKEAYSQVIKDYKPIEKSIKEWSLIGLRNDHSKIIFESDSCSLIDSKIGALIVQFHSKMNAIDPEILQTIERGIDLCENNQFSALVLANDGENFSVGANILLLYMAAQEGLWSQIESMVQTFQRVGQRLRYSQIPTVAAPFGLTLGGGCELSMWCDLIHAHAESYIGLVEIGVGLIPGGGGNIEMLDRTLAGSIDTPVFVTEPLIQRALETIAMAKVSMSALNARELLYLRDKDSFSMNRRYLLHDACKIAVSLAECGYRPPKKRKFRLPGRNAQATFDMGLRFFLDGGFISEHDHKIAMKIAHVMTGGATNTHEKVDEDYLLGLEKEAFLSLCGEKKSQERIAHMLEHNKPLRN